MDWFKMERLKKLFGIKSCKPNNFLHFSVKKPSLNTFISCPECQKTVFQGVKMLVTGVTGMPAFPTQFPYVKSICPPLSHLSHLSHFPPYTLNSPLFSCCRLINMAVWEQFSQEMEGVE